MVLDLESQLTPKTNFFRTLFINSQFSSVDFSFTFLCECEFIEINLIKTKLKGTSVVDPKTEKITFNDLEFDQNKPMTIQFTDSLFFPKKMWIYGLYSSEEGNLFFLFQN